VLDRMILSNRASHVRKRIGADNVSQVDVFTLVCALENVTFVKYPLGHKISGACLKCNGSTVIAVNSSMSLGRQRFSLAHELHHYYYDEDTGSIICPMDLVGRSKVERAANQFASYLLMPQAALYNEILEIKAAGNRRLTVETVVKLEQYFGVSRHAMVIRLQQEGEISESEAERMQKGVIRSAARLGYDTSLYKPTPENENKRTYGHYIKQAVKALQCGAVSTGKYEEWLLDAFRDDIVYGEEVEGGID